MTSKERFINALELNEPVDKIPHFELSFFLTMEALGKIHPAQRQYTQWEQMEAKERRMHLEDIADTLIGIARKYEHDAIVIFPLFVAKIDDISYTLELIDIIKDKTNDEYFLMLDGDATYSIPNGDGLYDFVFKLTDKPDEMKQLAEKRVDDALKKAQYIAEHTRVDGYVLWSDYCFNDNPFLSPNQFSEFITPYLKRLIKGYRDMGFYVIKHTDGNIMPILDQLVECEPHALHSIDPQGGVDIAEVKKLIGDKICLIGNVNCAFMDSGSNEDIIASTEYALTHGSPGGGYIFSTSNSIYPGMKLRSYELILDVWRQFNARQGWKTN